MLSIFTIGVHPFERCPICYKRVVALHKFFVVLRIRIYIVFRNHRGKISGSGVGGALSPGASACGSTRASAGRGGRGERGRSCAAQNCSMACSASSKACVVAVMESAKSDGARAVSVADADPVAN